MLASLKIDTLCELHRNGLAPSWKIFSLPNSRWKLSLISTTDNPLMNISGNTIHHRGNFQAASATSTMEKSMLATQVIGKLLFAQCSEIINHMMKKGLPSNLAIDDPSLSFSFKGVDINMAAHLSEPGYLTHPVSPHVCAQLMATFEMAFLISPLRLCTFVPNPGRCTKYTMSDKRSTSIQRGLPTVLDTTGMGSQRRRLGATLVSPTRHLDPVA